MALTARSPGGQLRAGSPVVVLLHGFGGSPGDLYPFARTLAAHAHFAFPDAPLHESHDPWGGSVARYRSWWPVDLRERAEALRSGPRDLSNLVPEGLRHARESLGTFLDDTRRALGDGPLVLGGFSQGAMLAMDFALHDARPLAGLVMLSGTRIGAGAWGPRFASRRGVPTFLSHGRHDRDLDFAVADGLGRDLESAGVPVTFCPFDGGHELAPVVLRALRKFLARFKVTARGE